MIAESSGLAQALNDALPQTQCTRCGYPDCRHYANAIAVGEADINQCPPGGFEGVERLASIVKREARPLNAEHGFEGPLRLALIDEQWCIGCTLCMDVCPVDCIVGAAKQMHTVVAHECTGCELCIPVCPVDCISLHAVDTGKTGWAAWSTRQADEARERYASKLARAVRDKTEADARLAALAAARQRRRATPPAEPIR